MNNVLKRITQTTKFVTVSQSLEDIVLRYKRVWSLY